MYVLAITVMLPCGGMGRKSDMGREKDLAVGFMASSTVPCHATQYSRPKKLRKSLPLFSSVDRP